MAEHDQLDSWLRQSQKLSEAERSIMQEEPCDVIKNLELLTALRKASEAEAPPNRSASFNKSRKKRNEVEGSVTDSPSASGADKSARSKGTAPRSSSVSSNTQSRDGPRQENIMVKIEEVPSEGTKGTIAERSGVLQIGAQVVFKHNKNKQGVEGEGIQCIIKAITGEGQKKRQVISFSPPALRDPIAYL
jgi:SAGA-associated factor 29